MFSPPRNFLTFLGTFVPRGYLNLNSIHFPDGNFPTGEICEHPKPKDLPDNSLAINRMTNEEKKALEKKKHLFLMASTP